MNASEYVYDLPLDYDLKPEHRSKLDAIVEKHKLTEADAQEIVDLHVEITEDNFKQVEAEIRKAGRQVMAIIGFLVILLVVAVIV